MACHAREATDCSAVRARNHARVAARQLTAESAEIGNLIAIARRNVAMPAWHRASPAFNRAQAGVLPTAAMDSSRRAADRCGGGTDGVYTIGYMGGRAARRTVRRAERSAPWSRRIGQTQRHGWRPGPGAVPRLPRGAHARSALVAPGDLIRCSDTRHGGGIRPLRHLVGPGVDGRNASGVQSP
jgi:hypothetical protein